MIGRVDTYPDVVLDSLEDRRFRDLLCGVKVALATPEVVDAFAVLYEDYLPIRTAGSFVFGAIDKRIKCATERLDVLCEAEGLGEECLVAARGAFALLDRDGDGALSPEEVDESCLVDLSPHDSLESLMKGLDRDADGKVTFLEFLEGSTSLFGLETAAAGSEAQGGTKAAGAPAGLGGGGGGAGTFQELLASLAVVDARGGREVGRAGGGDSGEAAAAGGAELTSLHGSSGSSSSSSSGGGGGGGKHGPKFDRMVATFSAWEALGLGPGSGNSSSSSVTVRNPRLKTVLRGCFVGARTEGVVVALRIVYEDYAPLRLAGDLIFKLMLAFVGNTPPAPPAPSGAGTAAAGPAGQGNSKAGGARR